MPQAGDHAEDAVKLWPTRYLTHQSTDSECNNASRTALIILNSPIADYGLFKCLYHHASFRVCADGGANRLYKLIHESCKDLDTTISLRDSRPDIIHGDLDSLDDNVRNEYSKLGVEISLDGDQYSTDFGKAIKKIIDRSGDIENVLVLGSIGGRVDQGIGLLHEFYREQKFRHPGIRFWLISESSISTVLRPGRTVLHTPLNQGTIERNIGILPLYGPASISTEGLE